MKVEQSFEEIVEKHSDDLNDINWRVLEATGLTKTERDGSTTTHGVGPHNLLPVVENLAFHLAVWVEFAKQIGVPEDKVMRLVQLATERARKVAVDMGEVFTENEDPSN